MCISIYLCICIKLGVRGGYTTMLHYISVYFIYMICLYKYMYYDACATSCNNNDNTGNVCVCDKIHMSYILYIYENCVYIYIAFCSHNHIRAYVSGCEIPVMWLEQTSPQTEISRNFIRNSRGSLGNLKTRPLDWNNIHDISMTLVGELWPERLLSCSNHQSLSRGDINLLAFQVKVTGDVTVHKFVSAIKMINHDIMSWHITTYQQTKEFWWVLWGLIRGPPEFLPRVDIFDIWASAFEFCQASKSVPNFHKCLEAKSSRITCTASWRNELKPGWWRLKKPRVIATDNVLSHWFQMLVLFCSTAKTTFFWWLRVLQVKEHLKTKVILCRLPPLVQPSVRKVKHIATFSPYIC